MKFTTTKYLNGTISKGHNKKMLIEKKDDSYCITFLYVPPVEKRSDYEGLIRGKVSRKQILLSKEGLEMLSDLIDTELGEFKLTFEYTAK